MTSSGRSGRPQLFTVKVWAEETQVRGREYRGEVTHAITGARCAFRDWDTLHAFLIDAVDQTRNTVSGPTGGSSGGEQ